MTLDQTLEAILFASAKSFSVKQLAVLTKEQTTAVDKALKVLADRLASSGIMLQKNGSDVELVTRPETAEIVKQVVNAEVQGELTRASLETLTILAYRGPLTRPELEQIRGIQSSIIIRNLLLRGLIEQKDDDRLGQPLYVVTFDFMNHLGLSGVEELPEYDLLRANETVAQVLEDLQEVETIPDTNQRSISV